jgi:hypothetical protein
VDILLTFMKNHEDNQRESATPQGLTVASAIDSEKTLGSTTTPEIASGEKAETQSTSYQRSRNVALMKLALLGGEQRQAE